MTEIPQMTEKEKQEAKLDETIAASFPASDPPSNTPITGSGPTRQEEEESEE